MPPPLKVVHVLILGTSEDVTLYGKGDFANVIKNFETRRLYWFIWWAQCNIITRVLIRGRQRDSK